MSAGSNLRSEDQFLCSICLDVFTDPVSTPCGHNFCKTCITKHWDCEKFYKCPLCNELFNTRPQLRVNTFIREMVDQFRHEAEHQTSISSEQQAVKPGEVPCDVCTGTRLKALKSCLVCLLSYCETHLEPHLTASRLKRHQLVDPVLILSADGKQVYRSDVWKKLPDTPERISNCVSVLGKQSFSSGRFYFEVQVEGKTKWVLGVVRRSINRKEIITQSPQNGYWTVCLENGNQYKAHVGPPVDLHLGSGPEKVGVFVDYEEGLVSFYDVGAAAVIYSFTGCCFSDKLHPFFYPGPNDGGKNSAPLIICPVDPIV